MFNLVLVVESRSLKKDNKVSLLFSLPLSLCSARASRASRSFSHCSLFSPVLTVSFSLHSHALFLVPRSLSVTSFFRVDHLVKTKGLKYTIHRYIQPRDTKLTTDTRATVRPPGVRAFRTRGCCVRDFATVGESDRQTDGGGGSGRASGKDGSLSYSFSFRVVAYGA